MKINVGDYVRTKYGVDKIERIELNDYDKKHNYIVLENSLFDGYDTQCYFTSDEVKSSKNIIDLIEVGDYVNGLKVEGVNNEIKGFGTIIFSKDSSIMEDYIYSIVTKEQFESMEYKI